MLIDNQLKYVQSFWKFTWYVNGREILYSQVHFIEKEMWSGVLLHKELYQLRVNAQKVKSETKNNIIFFKISW